MKRGFTLVELLAVIVILSIVGIITIPLIGDVIEESRKKALEQSAHGLIEAANYLALNNTGIEHFTFTSDGVTSATGNQLDYKGKIDATGELYIDEDGDISLCLTNDKYYVYKNYRMNDQVIIGEKKDNKTCIIGKDLLNNKYLAYEGEEGSSVNDNYYNKQDVDNLLKSITDDIEDIRDDLGDISDVAYQNQSDISDINDLLGTTDLSTTDKTLTGAINEVKSNLTTLANSKLKSEAYSTSTNTITYTISGNSIAINTYGPYRAQTYAAICQLLMVKYVFYSDSNIIGSMEVIGWRGWFDSFGRMSAYVTYNALATPTNIYPLYFESATIPYAKSVYIEMRVVQL